MRASSAKGKLLIVLLCLVAVACMVTGCRNSDALKEIILDQTAHDVAYDNPEKFYISDSTADEESDQVSAEESSKKKAGGNETQNLVVYSSDPNSPQYKAKQSIFSNDPDFTDIEASSKVFFYKSDAKDAVDHSVTKQEEKQDQQQENDDDAEATNPGYSGDPDSQEGAGGGGNGKDPQEAEDPDDNTSNNNASALEKLGKKARKTDPTRVTSNTNDPSEEPPAVDKVAAFGSIATIVEMIGGKGALAATDAKTLDSKFSNVFDTKGIVKGWSDGGSAKKMNVAKIVKSGAKVILVTNASYLKPISDEDFGRLEKAGITLYVLRPMTCSSYIKSNVENVGKILKGSKAAQYGSKTEERAEEYCEFHDRVVKACIDKNGGKLAGESIYQTTKDRDLSSSTNDDAKVTLLVDAYDAKASYKGVSLGNWKPAKGLAYASSGYATTPVSFYIQAGGLVNNAAAVSTKGSTGEVPLWQFNSNDFGFMASDWTGITVNLLTNESIKNTKRSLLDSGKNISNRTNLGSGFGTDSFPKLIAKTKSIKAAIIKNSKKSAGMYKPYGYVDPQDGKVIARFGIDIGDNVLGTVIGVDGDKADKDAGNLLGKSIPSSAIEVMPSGLFSDWSTGTVESFLLTAWVNDVVNEDASDVDWKSEAKDFYKTFYGYDLNASALEGE